MRIHVRILKRQQAFVRMRKLPGVKPLGLDKLTYAVCSGVLSDGRACKTVRDAVFGAFRRKRTLSRAHDWVVVSDLHGMCHDPRITIPQCALALATGLRPDIVLYSVAAGILISIELTAGWDGNFANQHKKKFNKYNDTIKSSIVDAGFQYMNLCVEVGCRGLVCESVLRAFQMLGVPLATRERIAESAGKVARVCSYIIWVMRRVEIFEYTPVYARTDGAATWRAVLEWAKTQKYCVNESCVAKYVQPIRTVRVPEPECAENYVHYGPVNIGNGAVDYASAKRTRLRWDSAVKVTVFDGKIPAT